MKTTAFGRIALALLLALTGSGCQPAPPEPVGWSRGMIRGALGSFWHDRVVSPASGDTTTTTVVISRVSDLPCHNGRVVAEPDGRLHVSTATGRYTVPAGGLYWLPADGAPVRLAEPAWPARSDRALLALLERAGVGVSDAGWEAAFRRADLAESCAPTTSERPNPAPAPRGTDPGSP